MSDTNLTALAYQLEAVYGVNPAPVVLKRMRMTKETLEHGKITVGSAEIRPDRQMPEKVEVGVDAKGSVDFELSTGSFDQFLEAALMANFADVAGTPTLSNGVLEKSFLLEKRITGASHMAFHGMMVDQLSLNFNSRQIVTGTLMFLGTIATHSAESINAAHAGAVDNYAAADTGLILSASSHVGNIEEAGGPLSSIKSLGLTINNNLRGNDVIGQKQIEEVGLGSVGVTGKVEAYFRTPALLLKFMNHEYTSLSLEVSRAPAGAVAGDHIGYRITLPRVTFDKGSPDIPGKDQDVMLPLDFSAVADDGATNKTIIIEKLLLP